MINTTDFFTTLHQNGIDFFCGVPDSLLKHLCACISDNCAPDRHVICANEGNAIGLAAGYHLGTAKIAAVYMQNSGLGNAINPLLSLADPEVYSIPMLLIIGWRGEPNIPDEPQHLKQGRITETLLQNVGIPYQILDAESDYEEDISALLSLASSESRPVALLVRKGTFLSYEKSPQNDSTTPKSALMREEALAIILQNMGDSLIISTTGKCSRELSELREKRGETQRDFLTVGSMGHSSSIAAGVALANPTRRVLCIDGDGAMLMHLGAMAVIGKLAPSNFIHILINNGCHESVGGQVSAADIMDFEALAQACAYKAYYLAGNEAELNDAIQKCQKQPGPILLEIKVKPGSRPDLGRPQGSPQDCKKRFMKQVELHTDSADSTE